MTPNNILLKKKKYVINCIYIYAKLTHLYTKTIYKTNLYVDYLCAELQNRKLTLLFFTFVLPYLIIKNKIKLVSTCYLTI